MLVKGDDMRKILSRILYTMFFGFSVTLVVSCVLLMLNNYKSSSSGSEQLEAVSIDPTADSSSVYRRIDEQISLSPSDSSLPDCDYAYRVLTDENEKYVYHKLQRNLYYITEEEDSSGYYKTEQIVVSDAEMSEISVRRALNAFLTDHPQVFWVSNVFGYAYDSGSTVIECYSVLSAEKCEAYIETLAVQCEELLDGVYDVEDRYRREKLIHDRLLSRCSYADGVTSADDGWQYFTAYGAIVDGSAVCEGYSKAMQMLLIQADIPSYTVRGNADDVRHMWNLVQLDDDWYHLDATWNDGDMNISYEYFNLSTEAIEENHTIDVLIGSDESDSTSPNFFLPECTTMKLNYYNVNGFTIDDFSNETDRKFIAYIVDCIDSGESYLHIKIGEDIGYDECLETLFDAPNHKIYHYIELANEFLDSSHKIDRTGMKMLKREDRRTVRIKLNIIE